MADCSKCQRTDVKCCYTCKKNADKCEVWHKCGSDCPEHESRILTNADRIRAMSDEELRNLFSGIDHLGDIDTPTVVIEDKRMEDNPTDILEWLQSEIE